MKLSKRADRYKDRFDWSDLVGLYSFLHFTHTLNEIWGVKQRRAALFMVLYMMLPHGASTGREILPGAIGAGFLWELAKKAFLSLVSTYISVSNLVYGSVAAMSAFLVWAYLSGLIFLFSAYVSVSYFQLKQQQNELVGEKCQ